MVKCLGADDHPAMPFFSLFVILWSVLFVSAWEQKSNDYSWEWGVYGEEKKERVRPEFKVRTTAQLHSSSCSSPSSSFSCCCCASHCLLLLHPPAPHAWRAWSLLAWLCTLRRAQGERCYTADGRPFSFHPHWKRCCWYAVSIAVTLLMLTVAFGIMICSLTMQGTACPHRQRLPHLQKH